LADPARHLRHSFRLAQRNAASFDFRPALKRR
jgi:hypothetical protein